MDSLKANEEEEWVAGDHAAQQQDHEGLIMTAAGGDNVDGNNSYWIPPSQKRYKKVSKFFKLSFGAAYMRLKKGKSHGT